MDQLFVLIFELIKGNPGTSTGIFLTLLILTVAGSKGLSYLLTRLKELQQEVEQKEADDLNKRFKDFNEKLARYESKDDSRYGRYKAALEKTVTEVNEKCENKQVTLQQNTQAINGLRDELQKHIQEDNSVQARIVSNQQLQAQKLEQVENDVEDCKEDIQAVKEKLDHLQSGQDIMMTKIEFIVEAITELKK